jgi:WXG100 family type VII secretion target
MVAHTSVDIEGMKVAQGHFQNAVDQVNTAYNNMSQEQGNLAANWTGEAASSFGNALQTWLADLNVVQTQLVTILEKLSTNTGVYANTSENSTQMANAFMQGLPGLSGL